VLEAKEALKLRKCTEALQQHFLQRNENGKGPFHTVPLSRPAARCSALELQPAAQYGVTQGNERQTI